MIDYIIDNAPVIGLVFFFCVFICIALWTYRFGAKEKYQEHANIPLKEDKENDNG